MNKLKNKKGITLVALIITIIVLIILAGITISIALGQNGIFKKARKATDEYQLASEKEAIQMSLTSSQLDDLSKNGSSNKLGEELNERSLTHSYDWHIVKENGEDGKTYGAGWNYVEEGTELEGYGNLKHSWVVNYETGEVKQLEKDKYTSVSAGDMLAVKEDLIINVDSSIIDKGIKNDEQTLEKQLGDGVELVNFNYDKNSGLTNESFNFDGKDDYIKVEYDDPEQKRQLAENGFTFEFYGIWNGGTSGTDTDPYYYGIFCYWNGEENKQAIFRFGDLANQVIEWNSNPNDNFYSDFSLTSSPHNILYDILEYKNTKPIYVTITLDTSSSYKRNNNEKYKNYQGKDIESKVKSENDSYYKQKVYINGELKYEGDYNKGQWDDFINNHLDSLHYFCVGRSSMHYDGAWCYSKLNAYSLRLYSRALKDEEVKQNYDKSVAYHNEIKGN